MRKEEGLFKKHGANRFYRSNKLAVSDLIDAVYMQAPTLYTMNRAGCF